MKEQDRVTEKRPLWEFLKKVAAFIGVIAMLDWVVGRFAVRK